MMRSIPILALVALLAGCKPDPLPSQDEIIVEFGKENPTATVIEATPGEGDFEHAYWHIRYRIPGITAIQETEWGARSIDDTDWEIFHRGNAQEAGP